MILRSDHYGTSNHLWNVGKFLPDYALQHAVRTWNSSGDGYMVCIAKAGFFRLLSWIFPVRSWQLFHTPLLSFISVLPSVAIWRAREEVVFLTLRFLCELEFFTDKADDVATSPQGLLSVPEDKKNSFLGTQHRSSTNSNVPVGFEWGAQRIS